MKNLCGFASRCLAVIVTAAVACSSPHAPLLGDDDGGTDAGPDASGDGGHPDAGVDAMPDAPEPGDLEVMCGSVPTTAEDWERCRAKRFCESHVHCSEKNRYANVQECIDRIDTVWDGQYSFDVFESVRAVTDGRASIDVAAFTQCLHDLSAERCSTAGTSRSCVDRYIGTIADEQPCTSDAECLSAGAQCEPRDCGDSCCVGTCTPRVSLGHACDDDNRCEASGTASSCCAPGLVCSVPSLTCMTGDVGSACGDCDAGAWCDHGVCRADLTEGAVCNSILQCRGETTCVGKYRGAEPARCRHVTSIGDACDDFCLGNLYCDLSNPTGFGVCRSLPGRDEACSDFRPCLGLNNYCEQGVCLPRKGPSQPCAEGSCLPGLFCTVQLGAASPVCRVLFADREQGCKRDAQCQSHLCSGNETTAGQCLPAQSTCP